MGIGTTLEEALLKGTRSLEIGVCHIYMSKFDKDKMTVEDLLAYIAEGTDDRIYAIAQLMWLGVDHSRICNITHIDMFFLDKIKNIVDFENLKKYIQEFKGAYGGFEVYGKMKKMY
jgi:carbamoyl-phosphate synthase large subunit